MPACLTHHYFAKTVLHKLADKEKIDEYAFYWGSQGPDFLFCHRYFPWMKGKSLKKYGNMLHKSKPSDTLNAMREFLKEHQSAAYRSYVMGFICHYALDSSTHPYINAFADELAAKRPGENQSTMHGEIEAALDAIILRRETGMLPSKINLKYMFPKNEGIQRRIAKLYHHIIFNVFSDDISEEELLRATKDTHFVFACVTDRTGLKRKLFDLVEKGRPHYITSHIVPLTESEDLDYANIQNAPWKSGDSICEKSFFELYDDGLALAQMLGNEFDTGDFSQLTGEKPFG